MNETRFDKLDDKLDDLKDEVAELKTVVSTGFAVYNEQLQIHIKGTNDNRDSIKITNIKIDEIKNELEPIKDHVNFIKKLGVLVIKIVTALVALGGLLLGILSYINK